MWYSKALDEAFEVDRRDGAAGREVLRNAGRGDRIDPPAGPRETVAFRQGQSAEWQTGDGVGVYRYAMVARDA